MANNPGRIQIVQGTYSNDCTTEYDLIANQAVVPEIRDMLEYANRRMLTTLLTSGVVTPYGINNTEKTKIPDVETKGKGIGNSAYQFRVMGRIEQAHTILGQVGSSDSNGNFTLKLATSDLHKGSVCLFYGGRYTATVMSQPRASAGGFLYDFSSPSGEVFDYATVVAPQPGSKTLFAGWTSFGEKSLRGYGESKFHDMFINYMTIQRDSISITGDARGRVLWYNFTNATGASGKGWMYEEVAQQRAKFAMKQERAYWFGVSNMKDANGAARTTSLQTDTETGLPIITGDGVEEQIAGGNVAYGSGINGDFTVSDIEDIMTTLEKKGDQVNGYEFVLVTGTDGYANFQRVAPDLGVNQNIQFFDNITQDNKPGGAAVSVGYNFIKLNINGNSVMVVKHPMLDDDLAFPERRSNGKLVSSSTCFFLNLKAGTGKNMEILHKAANGVNRKMVEATLNGMSGSSETPISQEDATTYAILSQTMINVYDTQTCGVLYPGS
jgi:hypothetical protein